MQAGRGVSTMKVLFYRLMARRRIIIASVVVIFLFLFLSTNQISDRQKMRRLLCSMRGSGLEGVDSDLGGNAFQVSVDRINDEIMQLAVNHRGTFEQRLPQAIVMGVRKCGTRALIEMLRMHPGIAAANPEIHFFDDNYDNGMEWYKEQMPFSYADQITMEKTPGYFITPEAPERIYRMNSSIKLLAIVRDPTVRTVSDYTQILSHTPNKYRKFPKFEEKVMDNGKIDTSYQAVRTSVYVNHAKVWLQHFPASQLMFVDGSKLIVNPLPEMKLVESFLGLPSFFTQKNFVYNKTKGFYCLKSKKLKCLGDKKGQSHPDVNPHVLHELQTFFRPYNEKFFELIGRRFEWS